MWSMNHGASIAKSVSLIRNLVVRLCPPTSASGRSGRRPSLFLAALLALAVSLSVLLAVPWPASGQQSDQEVPARPTGLTGTVSPEQVSLSWDDPATAPSPATRCCGAIRRRTPGECSTRSLTTPGSSGTSYLDTTVAAENRYFYRGARSQRGGPEPNERFLQGGCAGAGPDAGE